MYTSEYSVYCKTGKDLNPLSIVNDLKKLVIDGDRLFNNSLIQNSLKVLIITNNNKLNLLKNLSIPNIIYFNLFKNNLQNLTFLRKENLLILQTLNVSYNPIKSLNFLINIRAINLLILDFSNTHIKIIRREHFQYSKNIRIFKLENCNVKIIEDGSLKYLSMVKNLFLTRTFFETRHITEFINNMHNLQTINSEIFQLCCLAWKSIGDNVKCFPPPSGFLTCKNIIPSIFLRIVFWIIGIFGIIGNSVSIIINIVFSRSSRLYRISLSCGDFLTSLYVFCIAISDEYFSGERYLIYEERWRHSLMCTILGTTITFALLLTINSVLLITIERYESISNPLVEPFFKKHSKIIIFFQYFILICISILPVLSYKVNKTNYAPF